MPLNGQLMQDGLPPLCIVTDTLQTDSYWLLREAAPEGYFVAFRHPHKGGLDLSSSLFCAANGKFSAVSLDAITATIEEHDPAVLVLEHPDILVSSGLCTAARALEWVRQVSKNRKCIVSVCIHSALVSSSLPTHKAAATFNLGLLHSCHLQLNVNTLATGHSSEYSGVLEEISGPLAAPKRTRTFLFQFERDKVKLVARD